MPTLDPIQAGFHSGEFSGSARGRVDLPGAKYALAFCENWIPLPQGSLLRRAGTFHRALLAEGSRLFPFRLNGATDDHFILVAADGFPTSNVKVFTADGQPLTFFRNVIPNGDGRFDSSVSAWGAIAGGAVWDNGAARIKNVGDGIQYDLPGTVAGQTFKMQFRVKSENVSGTPTLRATAANGAAADVVTFDFNVSPEWNTYTLTFPHPGYRLKFTVVHPTAGDVWVDDVVVTRDGSETTDLVPPVPLGEDGTQFDSEPLSGVSVFVRNTMYPQTVACTALSIFTWGAGAYCWEAYNAQFVDAPTSWKPATYFFGSGSRNPSTVEFGYQGRLWLGVENSVWGSKSGSPFCLTLGVNDDDAVSKNLSMRGGLKWLKGQKELLAGSDVGEIAIHGSGGILSPSDFVAEDQSNFGSAPVQAVAVGDEVVYVTRDRFTIRAAHFLERQGWVSGAITFFAQHLTVGKVKELHYVRSPVPTIFALMENGDLRACTYDRDAEVVAWWRVNIGAPVDSAAVLEAADGVELWLAVDRPYGLALETLPLHETDVAYADAAYVGVVPGGGVVAGLGRFNGLEVSVVLDGQLQENRVVAGGEIDLGLEAAGLEVVVGLPYRSKATTLALEGANPAGTSQGHVVHYADITARVNDSAAPLLNGGRASAGRHFENVNAATDRVTGDLKVADMKVAVGGQIDIEQDLPLRTEVCAIYGRASVSKV